jgi:alpha-beta hydrolase superfamily lysophospholipase
MVFDTLHPPLAYEESAISSGELRLHAHRMRPTGAPRALLRIIHGYGEHGGRYIAFMRWMAERGVACEAVDLRGHGRSPGPRGYVCRWEEYLDDVTAFLNAPAPENAGESESPAPVYVLGHSHGGLIAAAAGERGVFTQAGVAGCILCSPYVGTRLPVSPGKRLLALVANRLWPSLRVKTGLEQRWLTSDPQMQAENRADALLCRSATPRWYTSLKAVRSRTISRAANFTLPLLCLAGEADLVADPSATADFFRRAGSADKSLYVYPNKVHELLRETGREAIFAEILRWMEAREMRSAEC